MKNSDGYFSRKKENFIRSISEKAPDDLFNSLTEHEDLTIFALSYCNKKVVERLFPILVMKMKSAEIERRLEIVRSLIWWTYRSEQDLPDDILQEIADIVPLLGKDVLFIPAPGHNLATFDLI